MPRRRKTRILWLMLVILAPQHRCINCGILNTPPLSRTNAIRTQRPAAAHQDERVNPTFMDRWLSHANPASTTCVQRAKAPSICTPEDTGTWTGLNELKTVDSANQHKPGEEQHFSPQLPCARSGRSHGPRAPSTGSKAKSTAHRKDEKMRAGAARDEHGEARGRISASVAHFLLEAAKAGKVELVQHTMPPPPTPNLQPSTLKPTPSTLHAALG